MKKVAFIMVGLLAILFSGCGEGSSTSTGNLGNGGIDPTVNEVVVENGGVLDTTITNEFGLNPSLGTPPPLPAS